MLKNTVIVILLLLVIYLYYSQKKTNFLTPDQSSGSELTQTKQTLITFLRDQLNSNNLAELKTKLGEKTLDEILEVNSDYETEVDTLTRTKNSLEQDLTAQSNAFQSRLKEKERENKKLKEDLASEKKRADNTQQKLTSEQQISKGNIERITKLTEQIGKLEEELKKVNHD